MQYQLSEASLDDADALVRCCQFPAMREDPLRKIMFPQAGSEAYEEEEEIEWIITGLRDSLANKSCYIRKVTGEAGCVGYAIWTLESGNGPTTQKAISKERKASQNPKALDTEAWFQVSKHLRKERQRVLHGQQIILRLNEISVAPEYQRKGAGTMLLRWGCAMADENNLDCFVMASPDAIRFYETSGFEAVGEAHTDYGVFTTMTVYGQKIWTNN
ncbi:hypothetical protein KCU99_g10041, partial [Aureobasidium melanogenum]